MRILYVFPHPDDESFGPAAAMHRQIQEGHEVYLLTLTKGGATKQRRKLGLSIKEMGEVRYKEMLQVEKSIGLHGMEVWDYPDNGLKHLDPRTLEKAVAAHFHEIRPQIVVTYPVHGISGFHDHLVTYSVVSRAFLEMKENGADHLCRLAYYTLRDNGEPVFRPDGSFRLKHSAEEEIDCVMTLKPDEIEALKRALGCYATYQDTIEESGVLDKVGDKLFFEIWGEDHKPVLSNLTEALRDDGFLT